MVLRCACHHRCRSSTLMRCASPSTPASSGRAQPSCLWSGLHARLVAAQADVGAVPVYGPAAVQRRRTRHAGRRRGASLHALASTHQAGPVGPWRRRAGTQHASHRILHARRVADGSAPQPCHSTHRAQVVFQPAVLGPHRHLPPVLMRLLARLPQPTHYTVPPPLTGANVTCAGPHIGRRGPGQDAAGAGARQCVRAA